MQAISRQHRRSTRTVLRARSARPATVLAALAVTALLSANAAAQDRVHPDQVHTRNKRTGRVTIVTGTVQTDGLEEVVVLGARETETKLHGDEVESIVWGDVPPSFRDGRTYFDRENWTKAAEEYRLAAGDASARDVVKAVARLRAARALLHSGAQTPAHFNEAVLEARSFLTEYPQNREVPEARMIEARALLLAGKPEEAGAAWQGVFSEFSGDGPTPGYEPALCMEAGLQAARAMLAANDTLAAREILTALDTAIGPMIASLDDGTPLKARLVAIQEEALLGDGFAELAAGNSKPALAFFQNKLTGAGEGASTTHRMVASLGLAEAMFAEGQYLEAEFLFAKVSALDHGSADRVALAELRMAQCELKLQHADSKERARTLLESVVSDHGDTPAAAQAREMLTSL